VVVQPATAQVLEEMLQFGTDEQLLSRGDDVSQASWKRSPRLETSRKALQHERRYKKSLNAAAV
jgi:hypothetical protein